MRYFWPFLPLILLCHLPAIASDIERITVSATRSPVQADALIGNISVLDANALSMTQHEHIQQLLAQVPGVWISRGNGQEHLTAVRSPVLTGAGSCGAFLVAQDGISVRAPGLCNANQLFDLNSEQAGAIEVVRGAGGAIYGTNAVHGIINLLTPNPHENPTDYLSIEAGAHQYRRGKIRLSHADWLVQANSTSDGGYKLDSGFDQHKLDLINQQQWRDWQIKTVFSGTHLEQETAGFIHGFDAYTNQQLKRTNPNPEAFRDSQSARLYSQWRTELNTGQLIVTPYWRWTSMRFLQHFLPWQPLERNNQSGLGVQGQYQFSFGQQQWQLGWDWERSQGALQEVQDKDFSPRIPAGIHYDYKVTQHSYSPWANVRWQGSERLGLTAGARYEHTRYRYHNHLQAGSACGAQVSNCRFFRPHSQTRHYNNWNYHTGISFQLNLKAKLYAKWSSGYRAPQASELFRLQGGQQVADLHAEKVDSIELGMRGAAKTSHYELAAFGMHKRHVIFQDTDRHNISNGQTRHWGIEGQFHWQFASHWRLAGNVTVAEHTYQNNLTLSRENIRGNHIDTAPTTLASAQLGWHSKSGDRLQLEWVHTGEYQLNPENTAQYSGHDLLNLRAEYTIHSQLQLSLRLLNLSNRDYAERADFAFGSYRYFVGEPRSMFVSLRYQFE